MILFVFVELSEEIEIGRDGLASFFNKLVRLVRLEAEMFHEIGNGERGRSADPGQTVYEHFCVGLATLLDESIGDVEVGQDLLAVAVVDGDAQKMRIVDKVRLGTCGAHV